MEALGLPSFNIVQNNISFNDKAGATRGLHAEPWNKFISTANGRVFGAWCDLRKGDSFGRVFTHEINPGTAIFVPKGVANGYQALDDNIAYTYLVDAHWSPDAKYTFVNLFDPALGIDWPISQDQAIIRPVVHGVEPDRLGIIEACRGVKKITPIQKLKKNKRI